MTDPNRWGPALWSSLHTITFEYPINPSDADKRNYQIFFHSLKNVLPCEQCRQHYTKMIDETQPIEPALKNRETLSRWLVTIHNMVNKRLGKPVVEYDFVKNKYESLKCSVDACSGVVNAQCSKSQRKTNNLLYLITILLIIVILMTIYYVSPRRKSTIQIVR